MATEESLQIVRGLPLPTGKRFKRENIEAAMDYIPKDKDVIVASYPKTGTTWLQYIVLQVVSNAKLYPSFDDATFWLYPYMEMVGADALDALPDRRIYKHHMPYNMVQKNERSKVIYIYRHPEDTLVSYYHFNQNFHPEIIFDFDEFFDNFVAGNISGGNYFKHVLSFYEHRDDSNLLMVSYEKLHANRRDEILRIAKFLGEEHHACLVEQDDILDKVMEHTSFEYMKKNLYLTHPETRKDGKERKRIPFFRKGIVGDGKNRYKG